MDEETAPRRAPDFELIPSSLQFPVVGIGASAGGLSPLLEFFEGMQPHAGMAFVVVMHLSPKHWSHLGELLQKATTMPVVSPEDAVPIEVNTVYVIPPSKLLSMNDSFLYVSDLDRSRGRHLVIDLFFRSLAMVHRERAFAIVLSGAGSDGAVGITRIKEEGGISMVQLPGDAEFDGMPRAAIATGTIDWVLPVRQMPAKLVELGNNAKAIEIPGADEIGVPAIPPASPQAVKVAEQALREILNFLRARTGHDFRNYKLATVLRRIERRLQVHGLPTLPAYRNFLHEQPHEAQALLKDLLIGVTNFFRDHAAFDVLQNVIARMVESANETNTHLRAWVAGCATGEEAYSIAMLLCEKAAQVSQPPRIHVFATDIDETAIAQARLGTYPAAIEADVSGPRLRRFFDREGDHFRIRKEVREKMVFAVHNLLHDPPFSKLDLISCRNLLIYLDREVHAEVLEMLHFALKPGGYLFLGSSESAETASQYFSVVDKRHRIFRANVVPRNARYVPNLILAGPPGAAGGPEVQRPDRRNQVYADLHRRLAEHYAPPSVLIDSDSNIVHLTGPAGRFLHYGAGTPSHNLMAQVLPELRLELRAAVTQALRTGITVEARRVRLQLDGRSMLVGMTVRPVHEPQFSSEPFAMIVFDEIDEAMTPPQPLPVREGDGDPLTVQLEDELARTKGQLQRTIEQSDTSTEELKASNEELQAINEELRSTTEELETSKEELQSINEELITVNNELKNKVEETGKVNDDLQNLIASTDIATVFLDRAMGIKRFTPHATRLFNLIPTDVGRSLLDITHKLDYDNLADDAAEAFQSLRMIEREVRSDTGEWFLARVPPYRTNEDRIDGAVLTFVDITSRRRAEDSMRLVAECTREFAIITIDLDGTIRTWSEGAARVLGYTEGEAVGMALAMLFVPEDRDAGVVEAELESARVHGRAEDDRWHLRKDGTRVYCSGITAALHEDGRLRGYTKFARDLTERQRSDAERSRALSEDAAARASSELKDEYLAVMSHELKNPLNLIQLNADLLARLPEARTLGGVQRIARVIRRTVLSQAQIIDDLLDLSRVNTGKLTLNRAPVDAAVSVETIVQGMREEAAAKGVTLTADFGARPLVIDADVIRFEQIVWNLLTNAVKFTPSGGRVTLTLARDDNSARLDVSDTGRGIDAAVLPHVFEMYRQAEPGGSRLPGGGLGIGLAVVRQLVELHGGRIEAASAGLDQGSRFTVWLPLAAEQAVADEAASQVPRERLAGRHVLVVDEDPASADTLRRVLETEGMKVSAAGSTRQALDRIRSDGVDAVLADTALPESNGHGLIAELRRDDRFADVPVIALAGVVRPGDAERALQAGFRAHLAKPVSVARLLSTLDEVLGGGEER